MEWRDRVRDAVQYAVGSTMVGLERLRTGASFNPFDRRYFSNPYPLYARLRTRDPIHRSRLFDGWVLSRYRDVLAVLKDDRFSADERNIPGFEKQVERMRRLGLLDPDETFEPSMLRSDAPDHTRLRKLVSKAFTPRAISRLGPRIEEIVREHLDAVERRGGMDVIADLATPLPVIVIAELIGVPREDRDRFKHWSNEVVRSIGFSNVSDARRSRRAGQELRGYFEEIAAQRRREPRDDLMSGLLAAEEEGDRLSEKEVFSTLELLLIAGNETTTNLIGNGTLALLRNPEQLERLRGDLSLVDSAVEELLRYDGPVQATSRIALEDLEFGGRSFLRGHQVFVLLGAANRDPAQFPDPNRLDVARPDNHHLAFGYGEHFCLGSNLARLEARHAFRALVERTGSMKLASDDLRWRDNLILHGLESLPVRF